MTASARSAANFLLLLCSTTAVMLTLAGVLFLIGMHLVLTIYAQSVRLIGESDAIAIALIFGGIAVALKTTEIRLRAERDSSID